MRWAPLIVASMIAPLLAPSVGAASAQPGGPEIPSSEVLDAGVDWILERQMEDGCLWSRRDADTGKPVPNTAFTEWAPLATAAAGHDPASGEPSLVDGLRACGISPDAPPDDLARRILALAAAGEDPHAFNGTDWVETLRDHWTGNQFLWQDHPDRINDDVFAVLALRAAGAPPSDPQVEGAARFVLDQQNGDGGWASTRSSPTTTSTTDMTAAALQALTAAGVIGPQADATTRALDYLADRSKQGHGCLEYRDGGSNQDVESTGWAAMALIAVHEDPRSIRWSDDASPWDCLRKAQADAGAFKTEPSEDGRVHWMPTRDALLGLAGVPFGRLNASLERPSTTLSTTSTPTEGERTTLAADGAAFAGWQHPDGRVLDGARTPWRPSEAGEITFEVLLLDRHGVADTDAFTTRVQPASKDGSGGTDDGRTTSTSAPTVEIDSLPTPERNRSLNVTVNATATDDPVVALRVDWGDGARTGWQASSRFEHTYRALGERTLTAWAKDADGDVSEPATRTLTVQDATPRIRIQAPSSVDRTEPFTAHVEVHDPDGPTPTVDWRWPSGEARGLQATLALQDPGPHTLEASATDTAGNQVNTTTLVHAVNRPPTNLSLTPLEVPANETIVLHANATDPDGDRLRIAWTAPGDERASSWGRQFHLATGPPGQRQLTVNASDPHGGWARADVTLTVRQDAAEDDPDGSDQPPSAVDVETGASQPAPPATSSGDGSPRAPVLDLPTHLTVTPETATLLEGQAKDPDGQVAAVDAQLGGSLPVRGTSRFTARIPALPPGTYTVTVTAVDQTGHQSAPTNVTLDVEAPPPDAAAPLAQTSAPDASSHDQQAVPALALPLVAAVLAGLALGVRRR